MKFFVLLFASLGLLVSSVFGFSTYITTSGVTTEIVDMTTGETHEWPVALYSGVNANGVELHSAYLRNADLKDASLEDAEFINADLRFADLSGAWLRYAYLNGADLRFADLRGAVIGQVYGWSGALLYGATFDPEWDASFFEIRGADLTTIPEPSTYALLLGGTVLGYAFWRRRQ